MIFFKNGEVFLTLNSLTGFAVLRLIREAIRLDNQRTKPSFQYSPLDARNDSCCATGNLETPSVLSDSQS